jgi:Acetoacetate decarboxylase (ADC)
VRWAWSFADSISSAAALVTPPPWHYSGHFLSVDFTSAAGCVAEFFPPEIRPAGDGSGSVVIADWSSRSDSDPRLARDPARGQHREAYVLLYGHLRGATVGRVAGIWVDNDLSLVRGLVQGFPKKLGQVFLTKEVDVGRGGAKRAPGERFCGRCSTVGLPILEASVTLASHCTIPPRGLATPLIHTRYWPSMNRSIPDASELSRGLIRDFVLKDVFVGSAELNFQVSPYEDIASLGPLVVGNGYYGSVAFSVVGAQDPEDHVRSSGHGS